MPYIEPSRRHPRTFDLDDIEHGYAIHDRSLLTPGELNWMFTLVIRSYVEQHGTCYQTINDILGALEGAKQEFYRRVAVPYEETKRTANGDVYGNPST